MAVGVGVASDRRNFPRAAVFLGGYCRFAAVTAEAFAASRLMLLLCCGLLSLADGGSTTVVAGGFHLPHCCHWYVSIRHRYAIVTAEGTPRRSEIETIAAVHGNRAGLCPVFWTRSFLLKRICPHKPLQTPLRCTTLRAALLVFSSFHDVFELGGVLTASSLFNTLCGFAFTLVYGHRLRSTFFIKASSTSSRHAVHLAATPRLLQRRHRRRRLRSALRRQPSQTP